MTRAQAGVDYVAWCLHGQCRAHESRPEVSGVPRMADSCRRIAEKLSFDTDDKLDGRLLRLGTGRLIRTVLATARGAVYCEQVVPGSYLVGVTIGLPGDQPAGRELAYRADEAIADRVEHFRDQIHGRRYDLGSWHSEHMREELRATPIRPRTSEEDFGDSVPSGLPATVTGRTGHPAVPVARDAVRAQDLQLVALFDESGPAFCVDVLHDPRVAERIRHDQRPSAAQRRGWYQELGAELPDYLLELAKTARGAIGGPLIRAVLDVEDGAVYYRRLDASRYVVGLTVFQEQVFPAERRVDAMMDAWPA
ncbi:hypothetical protein [Actinoplanes siamensis]|uniref:hypothetical protein n=1 Tax=Actinoplanes siamensis TaxID=1223317 RepID=UPI001942F7FB|nr:hypothetical protein [Actinoplanes siamensis]